ncbi:peptidase-like protein [Calothrix brevissima NIES-22]|nr:peptidase-like protein [Calothrix brevissima NIES-22]
MSIYLFDSDIEKILKKAIVNINDLLNSSSFDKNINLAFGENCDRAKAKDVITEIINYTNLPEIKIVDSSAINGGQGAYSSLKKTIYLSTAILNNPTKSVDVLIEELGHYIDSQINIQDAQGDEGAIFAAIVQGKELTPTQVLSLKSENDTTTVIIDGQKSTLELSATYGNISLDGNLSDWTTADRLDSLPGTRVPGYELYGKYAGDAYVFAFKSDSEQIGAGATLWLNTDRNSLTGYQIFGLAGIGGAEYNVNFFSDDKPYLYTGADGENFVTGPLDSAYGANNKIVEFAVPISLLNGAPQAIDVVVDINNDTFLPSDYSTQKYTVYATQPVLPPRTNFSKKVGIVFSETTAKNFFQDKAYTQLFMSMQSQAMQAGIPFDILTEDDLTDISKVVNYDALIFPYFANVPLTKLDAIQNTLTTAVYQYNIGIITAGDFLTNDENNNPLAGDSYIRMKQLLNLGRTGGSPANTLVNGVLNAEDITHPVMQGYSTDEVIRTYNNITFNSYGDADSTDELTPIVLADFEVNGEKNNAVIATQTGGRNVHFSTPGFMADNNLVWKALQWVVLDNKPKVALNMSRDASIFISRNDMDQSQEAVDVNPDSNTPGIYDRLLPIVSQWKNDYNFVGSYYINVGNNPANGQFTDWTISKPYYEQMLALQNEIGTHSYTHPEFTDQLTPTQLEFEFNQAKSVIEQQLGIQVLGAAIPGNPEGLGVSQELQKYLSYVSGGYASVGAGYPNAFGFMFPGSDYVYFAPNMSFDFSLVEFRKLTPQQAEAEWLKEYNGLTNHAAQAIIHFPWHDYAPTVWDTDPEDNISSPYTEAMFTNFIARAYNDNTEFVTVADLSQRIKSFEKSQLFIDSIGNTITANVVATDVGTFGLNIDPSQTIQSVNNWYAYDKDTVFLPASGGQFTINLGTLQDDVTHIIDLPMRAKLTSVIGNGTDLEFSFFGEGKVVLDLINPTGFNIFTDGANSITRNGEILEMNFNGLAQHNGRVRLVVDTPPTVANPIADVSVLEDAAKTIIDLSNVFNDIDNDPLSITKTIKVNSNSGLVNANIVNNELILTYLSNQFGAADITIIGTSNGQSVDNTFTVNVASVDDAPVVVNPILDVNSSEDAPNTIIDLSQVFTDVDNDSSAIIKTLQANSNSSLVNASIDGNNLVLAYKPNQFGTAAITISGTSNGQSVENTFTVNVAPVDDAPVVANPILDVNSSEDAPNTIIDLSQVFTDIDNDSSAIIKTLQANSNSSLVNASIDGNNLVLAYQPNQFGTAAITISGTSNGKTVNNTFTVNVAPVDDAPIVANSIADVVVTPNSTNTIIDLSSIFTDIDNEPSEIIKTIAVNTNNNLVNASIDGNNLVLAYQPNQVGTAAITISGTSNGKTVDDTFTVNVAPVDNPPTVAKPIVNVNTSEDAPNTIIDLSQVFTDVDNDVNAIIKTIQANSNSSLVNASIINNDLILAYQPNQFGTAAITIRGTSNGKSVDNSFTVNVAPVDDAPIVANPITDVVVNQDSANTTINLSSVFTDIDNAANTIIKTIQANNNSSLVNATIIDNVLTLQYLRNQFGTAQVTIRGNSNGLTVDNTFNINVKPVGNIINGTDLNNTIAGTSARDIINGFAGDDSLDGKAGNDVIYGGDGNDTLIGGTGNDILYGGAGNDKYTVDSIGDVIFENVDSGIDIVSASVSYTLADNIENLTLTGTSAINGVGNNLDNILTGNAANNTLIGNGGNDSLNGGAGDDILYGDDGNDTLIGGIGNDTLYGGVGNDSYTVDSVGDVIIENANSGIDIVNASVSYTLLDNVENLTLTGTLAIDGVGNNLNNILTGNAANNILFGNGGNDTLNGGAGDDVLYGGDGDDQFKAGAGNDILYGDLGNDLLDGQDGNDTLYGGKGNDKLLGNIGIDTLIGVDPNSTLAGAGEIDTLTGGTEADLFVLGDRNRAYYNDGIDSNLGLSDYALITDFRVAQGDKIQLFGNSSNYVFGSSPTGLPTGRAIYLITPNQNELIAIVQGDTSVSAITSGLSFV